MMSSAGIIMGRDQQMTQADKEQREPQPATTDTPDATSNATRKRRPKVREPFREQQKRRSGVQLSRTPDYLVIGHVTADLQPNGEVILGGTALYSALAAARLGARVAVLTRGVFGQDVAGMQVPSLEQYAGEISIIVQDADVPTTFVNEFQADRRVQTIRHWAGPIDLRGLPPHWRNARIVHLGPVADEIDPRHATGLTAGFLGVTPQGWMRDWPHGTGGKVRHVQLRLPGELIGQIDCAIVSIEELVYTREVVERVGERRLSVVTMDRNGARVIAGGVPIELPGFNVKVRDLNGAGDVFAAAFFLKAADKTVSARTAGRFANAVAALSLREIGVGSIPSKSEIDALLEE
jgi:sugar/nucleoside kinase (ribokinase family)